MNGLEVARERLTDDGEPPLSFEQWRALAPRLSGREADEREALLAAAKIEPARWDRADGYWSLTLAAECARGERARAEDFGRACAEEQESRKKASSIRADDTWPEGIAPPALAETAPSGATLSREGGEAVSREEAPALPVLASRGTPAELPALVQRPEVVIPTFLRADAAGRDSELPAAGIASRWPARALPEPATPAPVPPALVPTPPARGDGATLDVGSLVAGPAHAPMPFVARPSGAPALLPPRPALPPASGATVDISSLRPPFGAPPASPRPQLPAEAGPAGGAGWPGSRDSTATVALDPDLVARMLANRRPIDP